MKRWYWISGIIFILALILFFINIGFAAASGQAQVKSPIRLGGELYDNWIDSLGAIPPDGNMPLWSHQTTSSASGPDTWRCVTCHGWDYQGKDGAYRTGSNYTGFPGLLQARYKDPQFILDQLTGKIDPAHDYSQLMDRTSLNALVEFITQGLVNDDEFIDPISKEVIDGNAAAGKGLFDGLCANCHGADGAAIQFRFEGLGTTLGTLAVLDPWRFLHRSRFGTPGTAMSQVVGVDQQWTPQQARDVLLYTQSLPTGLSKPTPAVSASGGDAAPGAASGSGQDWLSGLINAVSTIANSPVFVFLGAAALFGFVFLVIWTVRGNRK